MRLEPSQDFAKRQGIELKLIFFAQKMSNLDLVLSKAMQLKRIAVGTWMQNPSRWVIFVCLCPPQARTLPRRN